MMPELPEGVERWMVDYEHGDGDPQHAVLSWSSDEPANGLPEVGTVLMRVSDLPAIRAAVVEEVLGPLQELAGREPVPFDRERFTIAICPKCGRRGLLTPEQRAHGGRYCYCRAAGEGTRCEEIEAVALDAALKGEDRGY